MMRAFDWIACTCFMALIAGRFGLAAARDSPKIDLEWTSSDLTEASDTASAQALLSGTYNGMESDCKAFCGDEEVASLKKNGTDEDPEKYDCWGKFRVFCKPANETIKAVFGMKCEGHFLAVNVSSNKIVACEGALKQFAAAKLPPKSGESDGKLGGAVAFKGGACVGTGSVIVSDKDEEDDASGSAPNLPVLQSLEHSAIAEYEVGIAQYLADRENLEEDIQSEVDRISNDDLETVAEGRCKGFSIKASGIKKKSSSTQEQDEPLPETSDDLEGAVESWARELGLPLDQVSSLDAYQAGQASPAAALLSKPKAHCGFSCNGKPAWLDGQFPCWGKAGACCSVEGKKGTLEFDVTCKGFYSGWFGHVCKGFTSGHVSIEPEADDMPDVEKRGFCVGTHGVNVKKGKKGFGMAAWCKGSAVFVVQIEEDEESKVQAGRVLAA